MTVAIQTTALDDMLRQIERYRAQGLTAIARRFAEAAQTAIDTVVETPMSGQSHVTKHAALADLVARPVKGFADFQVYYQARPDTLTILRILHAKRDIDAILTVSKETP